MRSDLGSFVLLPRRNLTNALLPERIIRLGKTYTWAKGLGC